MTDRLLLFFVGVTVVPTCLVLLGAVVLAFWQWFAAASGTKQRQVLLGIWLAYITLLAAVLFLGDRLFA